MGTYLIAAVSDLQFSDLALSKRLELAEGHSCYEYAETKLKLFPQCGAECFTLDGARVIFDSKDSFINQTFGLGLFEEFRPETLDHLERFFRERNCAINHEVSPLVGVDAFRMLCSRGYKPIEISSIMYCPSRLESALPHERITVRKVESAEADIWIDVNSRAWGHETPDIIDFLLQVGAVGFARDSNHCFLAEFDGEPAAAGSISIHEGVGLLQGAATLPQFRGRGLQPALLRARLNFAAESGCDMSMIVAEAGSTSQKNAERQGFRIAYTRTKWSLELS